MSQSYNASDIEVLSGLEPVGDYLVVDPVLPETIGRIELLDIPGRWGRIDAFGRGRLDTTRADRRSRVLK